MTDDQDALIPAPNASVDSILAGAGRRPRGPRQPKPGHPLEHLATKHPDGVRATWCTTCKAPILTGLDDVVCAFDARTDVVPLSPLGEALARIGGLVTYELRTGKPPRIVRRTAWMILARPAGATTRRAHAAYDVVAAHRCQAVAVGPLAGASALPAPASSAFDQTQPPPF